MSFIDKAKKKLGDFADSAKDAVTGKDDKAEGAGEKAVNSSSQSTIDQVKGKQGIISKIQDFFTLGYSTKEDLRATTLISKLCVTDGKRYLLKP
jgi:uncharacterized protein YjbJ (UPF0337 family)